MKTRLFSDIEATSFERTKKQRMTFSKDPIVQFQFSDPFIIAKKDWFEILKAKLREPNTNKQKHVFIGDHCGTFTQWKIVYHAKTHDIENLELLNKKDVMNYSIRILSNNQSNQLIFYNNIETSMRVWEDEKYKTFNFQFCLKCMAWYANKYLIIGFESGEIQIWDWDTKQVFKTLRVCGSHVTNLLVDEKNHELLVTNIGKTGIWSLKTFKRLKTFDGYFEVKKLCFISELFFATCSKVTITIWNKKTGKERIIKEPYDWSRPPKEDFSNLIYSNDLKMLVSCSGRSVWCWKLGFYGEHIELENDFKIKVSSSRYHLKTIQFLDTKQTRILVSDICGTIFHVDLILKKVVCEMSNTGLGCITSITVQ